ncbi:MAG: hypothetical protein KGL39_02510 [Patescibacteria group bacterium]|nr:hypothetical protein [Patescibacteria group bacterium]
MSKIAQESIAAKPLRTFFVVTMTSIYQVKHLGGRAAATKIAIGKETPSSIAVGETLPNGTHIAIGERVSTYTPKPDERHLELLARKYVGSETSAVVGLFLSKKRAEACFRWADRKFYDLRWMRETNKVLGIIGEDHPTVYVFRIPGITASSRSY